MDISIRALFALARHSVQSPRAAARYIMALDVPDAARWLLVFFVSTASVLLTFIGFQLLPPANTAFTALAMVSPVRTALLQTAFLVITVIGVHKIGRWRGGKGSFSDALLLIGWLQFILLCLQVAQIAALVFLPPLAELLGAIGLVLSFWVLTHFIAELHGFASAWRVFAAVMAALFVAALAVSMVIVMMMGAGG